MFFFIQKIFGNVFTLDLHENYICVLSIEIIPIYFIYVVCFQQN